MTIRLMLGTWCPVRTHEPEDLCRLRLITRVAMRKYLGGLQTYERFLS